MKHLLLFSLVTFLASCSSIRESQLKHVCNYSPAYNIGKADAALQEKKNYVKFNNCSPNLKEELSTAYDEGYNHYMNNESNKVGHVNGTAGNGAKIQFVCVGTLFGLTYIGKGQSERIAKTHLRYNCNASDNSIHCTSMFNRCRRVNYGQQI